MRHRDADDAEEEDAELDDRELPDPSDVDDADDENESDTKPCPHCRKPVYEDADVCPHCRNFISTEAEPPALVERALTIIVVLCLIIALMWALFG